ncbi:hypothetical protein ADUPG1_004400, partial [Aduncisulcus paluster]
SALDTLYEFEKVKLKFVNEKSVTVYAKKYRQVLSNLEQGEILTEDTIAKKFIDGIVNPYFRTRMVAATEGQEKTLKNLTKVLFAQQRLVKEACDDAMGYQAGKSRSSGGLHKGRKPYQHQSYKRRSGPEGTTNTPGGRSEVVCFNCGGKDHFARDCPKRQHRKAENKALTTTSKTDLPYLECVLTVPGVDSKKKEVSVLVDTGSTYNVADETII